LLRVAFEHLPRGTSKRSTDKRNWASGLTLAAMWGIPAAAMLLTLLLEPTMRGIVWIAMPLWMA
jgi:hypothetical protein